MKNKKCKLLMFSLFVFLAACVGRPAGHNSIANDVKQLLSKDRDNEVFSKLDEPGLIDEEVIYIYNAKEKIDACLVKLLKITENDFTDISASSDMVIEYLYSVRGLTASMEETSSAVSSHVDYMQSYIKDSDEIVDEMSYPYIKHLRANKDSGLLASMVKVAEQQRVFNEVQIKYNMLLMEVLVLANDNDYDSMIKKLTGEDARQFYKTMTELVLVYYDFEESRASGIMKAYSSYKELL